MALRAKWAPQPFVFPFRRVFDAATPYRGDDADARARR